MHNNTRTHFHQCKVISSIAKSVHKIHADHTIENLHARPITTQESHPEQRINIYTITDTSGTYTFGYKPGIRANATDWGRGSNHLSGFHSVASLPHSLGSLLQFAMPTMMFWFFETWICEIICPSLPFTGVCNGTTTS
jgi:hypothetical protein